MKKAPTLLFGILLATAALAQAAEVAIVPKPVQVKALDGTFTLDGRTGIAAERGNADAQRAATYFAKLMKARTGIALKKKPDADGGKILFTAQRLPADLPADGYLLDIIPKGIMVRAGDYGGFFYGIQTLMQLMPAEVFGPSAQSAKSIPVACVEIHDWPRFTWRAMMLDCSRQFFTAEEVKRYIDHLAVHKINLFHWHLTDDDGWRIEIKAWPELTNKGAWRGKDCVLPASRGSSEDEKYGGYYTQEQIREIVQYALERNIQILPEIDLPGHSLGVTASYPETLCDTDDNSASVQGVKKNVWCAGREANYKMIDDIIRETAALFPFEYIHIGGDEVNKKYWESCTRCQALMEKEGFKNVGNIQNYFIRRMEKTLKKHDRKIIGWNEILHGGNLGKETAIMSWISTGPGFHAAKLGHPVVMSPGPYTYFDMAQYPGERGHWWAGVVNTEKTYSFDPMSGNDLTDSQKKNIFGVEACLWSEYLDQPEGQIDFQTYPRLCALAEVCWTPKEQRNWDDFSERLGGTHLARLEQMDIHFRVPHPTATVRKGMVTIAPPYSTADVRYTLDGSEPTAQSAQWKGKPFPCGNTGQLRMRTFRDSGRTSPVIKGAKQKPFAEWNEKTAQKEFSPWEIDITESLDSNGRWTLELRRIWGKNGIEIRSLQLLENGKPVFEDTTPLTLGDKKTKTHLYRIPLKSYKKSNRYALRIELKQDGGPKSRGTLILDQSPYLDPEVESVESNMPAYGNHVADHVADGNHRSYFWVGRKPKKGDQLTVVFKEPVACSHLEVITGKLNTSQDILVEGDLEISRDGKSFKKASGFEFGTARAKITGKIKAVRIRCIAGQGDEWLVIQNLRLKP
ncbi:MAG: family 20 glycosylhydrolase [Verrucomicrobia bacterium]|nr:family 20 glycosylhydrolase [Verrucomicrobiota bacterium]